ncbi:MAG: hypothetical protein KDA43_10510 [Hyphomonas sp.]|nr:hypothetical protein [Hyphomonas sp.]
MMQALPFSCLFRAIKHAVSGIGNAAHRGFAESAALAYPGRKRAHRP